MSSYWRRRALQYEKEWQEKIQAELEVELAAYFKESLAEIERDIAALYGKFARDNRLSYSDARKLIRGAEFKEWRMTLAEYVALSHTNSKILRELNTLAMRSRISRLEKLYSETLMQLQNLGERYERATAEFLRTAYRERYYRGIYDLATVGKLEIPVSKVEPAQLEKVLAQRWQGGNYSSRIWRNTEQLSKVLKSTVTAGLHRGLSVQKLSASVERQMGAGYKNAERLVRTELNFTQNYAAKESLEAAGLSEYEFIAVLDNRTTPRCQALDGTFHLLEEYSPGTNAPPMHPRCRSTISAVIEGGTRTAKNGRNIRIPADWNYEKWRSSIERDRISNKAITLTEWYQSRTLTTPVMTVADAKTFAELQVHWAENYNVRVADELKGVDFQALKKASVGIEAVLAEFPNARQALTEFKIRDDERVMSTSYSGQINFNPRYFGDLNKLNELAKTAAEQGFHPKNTGVREYGAHEAGHILELALIQKYGGNIGDWASGIQARKVIRKAYRNLKERNSGKHILQLYEEISEYAKKRISECLAEAVADYVANAENAAELSQEIWKILKQELD